jgi:hypothetical protein
MRLRLDAQQVGPSRHVRPTDRFRYSGMTIYMMPRDDGGYYGVLNGDLSDEKAADEPGREVKGEQGPEGRSPTPSRKSRRHPRE